VIVSLDRQEAPDKRRGCPVSDVREPAARAGGRPGCVVVGSAVAAREVKVGEGGDGFGADGDRVRCPASDA
jgi:hypothetical protein